ncbi:MAG: polyribonucleotide nucleotidyltransferase [Candidatus Paceibacterota bacterium]
MEKKIYSLNLGNKNINVEFSNLAEQTNGSVLLRMGETIVAASAVMAKEDKKDVNFFPLLVDYEEKYYASGKIYGSRFIRRESRPTELAILVGRLIDRTIRPLFPDKMKREVQVVVTCLSFDEENDPAILGIIAASLALGVSNIPWQGPISAVRIGWSKEKGFVFNPRIQERDSLGLDLVVSGPEKVINMIEGEVKDVPEEIIKEAIAKAYKEIEKTNEEQLKIISERGRLKEKVIVKEELNEDLNLEIKKFLEGKLEEAIYVADKNERENELADLLENLKNHLREKNFAESDLENVSFVFEIAVGALVHHNILNQEKRPDGRSLDEIRPLEMAIDILPRPHGSALFIRGKTHVLSVVTLGAPGDVLVLQGMELTGEKRFMHHYNFPAYSSGEIGPIRSPGRREIGHGALGEKALNAVIPSQEEFPYTIRVVSEVFSSNGSTSMAATCASSLALMAAGVPVKTHVAGIAMGLVSDEKGGYKILTDIQGPEDHYGDMDFKVAGTRQGITALQMDVKIKGITPDIVFEVLDKAKNARFFILERMEKIIPSPRQNLSPFAPRIFSIKIKPEQIGLLIGTGGKNIRKIMEETETEIDIEEDGTVFVTALNEKQAETAVEKIKNATKEFNEGDIVEGKVVQIRDFGAIVELGENKDGMIHISELASHRVGKVEDVVQLGEKVKVKVKKIENGKISLSLKDANKSS